MESRPVKVFSPRPAPLSNFDRFRAVLGLVRAVRYLTIVPVSGRRHAGLEDLGAAAPWFPVVGAALGLVLGWAGVVALGVGVGGAAAVAAFLTRRLGGVTGDVLGAGVELAELTVLLTVSAWTHARP